MYNYKRKVNSIVQSIIEIGEVTRNREVTRKNMFAFGVGDIYGGGVFL